MEEIVFLLLCMMPPSRPVNCYLALAVQQALGCSDGGSSHGRCILKDPFSGWTVITCR